MANDLRDPYNPTEALFEVMRLAEASSDKEVVKWTTKQVALLYVNLFILVQNRVTGHADLVSIVQNKGQDHAWYRDSTHYKLIQKILDKVL